MIYTRGVLAYHDFFSLSKENSISIVFGIDKLANVSVSQITMYFWNGSLFSYDILYMLWSEYEKWCVQETVY